MELIKYNQQASLPPFGLVNMGATCYFNSILQSLLSCTSFIDELMEHKEDPSYQQNPVAKYTIEMIELGKELKLRNAEMSEDDKSQILGKLSHLSPQIWKSMVRVISHTSGKPIEDILQGQQCAREGFHLFMDSLDEFNNLQNLVLHRYKSLIHCFDCNEWVSDVDNIYSIFEVDPDLKIPQLDKFKHYEEKNDEVDMNKFLTKQTSYIDKDYKCPKCQQKGEKYNMNCLVMVPEILVVLSKKYIVGQKLDTYTNFPKDMVFNGNNGMKLNYTAVSQVEHVGGMQGGHYWAISKRDNGWYCLNDDRVSESEFKPTTNTYMVFYHLSHTEA
jgi:ubiquitin C-terminal hydrolase